VSENVNGPSAPEVRLEVSTDNVWQRRARRLQSSWRDRHEWAAGPQYLQPDSVLLGNMLTVGDGAAGHNFITPVCHRAAVDALANKELGAVISADRLMRNLLASQPMCFNLFGELSADPDLAARVLARLLPDLGVTKVQAPVLFEHSPGRGRPDYTGDRSAFDVAVRYRASTGALGLVGVEVKYHENLASTETLPNEYLAWLPEANESSRDELTRSPLVQLLRDHRLARAVVNHPESPYTAGVTWVLLFPTENSAVAQAAASYLEKSGDPHDARVVTLEAFLAAASAETSADWPALLADRYLGVTGG
jgi:hypothetical protein